MQLRNRGKTTVNAKLNNSSNYNSDWSVRQRPASQKSAKGHPCGVLYGVLCGVYPSTGTLRGTLRGCRIGTEVLKRGTLWADLRGTPKGYSVGTPNGYSLTDGQAKA